LLPGVVTVSIKRVKKEAICLGGTSLWSAMYRMRAALVIFATGSFEVVFFAGVFLVAKGLPL